MLTTLLFSFFTFLAAPELPPVVYLSTDQGTSWVNLSEGLPQDISPSAILSHKGKVYMTSYAHGIYVLPEGEREWQSIGKGFHPDVTLTAMAASGNNMIVGTFERGIYLSRDGGAHWQESVFNVQNCAVRSIKYYAGGILAGTDKGLYHSWDGGMSWSLLGDHFQVNDIAVMGSRIITARSSGLVVSNDNGKSWQNVYKDHPMSQLRIDGEFLYAYYNAARPVVRFEPGMDNWTPQLFTLPGVKPLQSTTLPEALWFGYSPNMPEDADLPRVLYQTDMGWIATRSPGC